MRAVLSAVTGIAGQHSTGAVQSAASLMFGWIVPVGGEVVDLFPPGQGGVVAHGRQVRRDTLPGCGEDQAVHGLQLHQVQERVGEHRVEAGHEAEPAKLRVEGGELQGGLVKGLRLREEEIFLVVQSN